MSNHSLLSTLVGSIILGIYLVISGSLLLKTKIPRKITSIIILIELISLTAISYLYLDNFSKMMIAYIAITFSYKAMFKKYLTHSAIASLISYLLLTVGELIFIIILSIVDYILPTINTSYFRGELFANLLISCFAFIILLFIHKRAQQVIVKIKEHHKFTSIFTFAILLMGICVLFYAIASNEFKLDETLIFSSVFIIAMTYVGVVLIREKYEKSKISDEYERYVIYSKQSEKLVEEYSVSQHENKNELIVIKSMVHKNNKKLLEYMNEIIASKDNISYAWIRKLRYIPFGGLKGIIHNKVSEMKEKNINVSLEISKDIEKSKLKKLTIKENSQLLKIIGVFLDNAMEASLVSETMEVVILVYKEKDNVIFEIANSFNNDVNINEIYNAGNTTKGKNRGYGLYLAKSIIEENELFENVTKVEKDHFVQKVIIKF